VAAATALPTSSHVQAMDTSHLREAAAYWTRTAKLWEETFTEVHDRASTPGGMPWEGEAATRELERAYTDTVKARGTAYQLHEAAAVANRGDQQLQALKGEVLNAVHAARADGFDISEDYSVADRSRGGSSAFRTARQTEAQEHAGFIRHRVATLVVQDREIAGRITATIASVSNLTFREGPDFGGPPREPPPDPVPFPPYEPKVWAVCRARGQDPGKVVRTFYHAPISAGFRSLPAGDSVLYCGNDKYGMLHIQTEHGPDWQRVAASRWPTAGNWRYLADYSIGATLAYPERWSTTKATIRSPCTERSSYQMAHTPSRPAWFSRQVTGRSLRLSRKLRDELAWRWIRRRWRD
jgi:hypothetical protein